MRAIALRFAENFAPECGTVSAHQELIDSIGHVWYGKLGSSISRKTVTQILANEDPRFLLIHSGRQDRWWAHVEAIQRETPPLEEIPSYYRNAANKFGCWFKVKSFEEAEKSVMLQCVVASSGKALSSASRHSMSPYFIINYAAK